MKAVYNAIDMFSDDGVIDVTNRKEQQGVPSARHSRDRRNTVARQAFRQNASRVLRV